MSKIKIKNFGPIKEGCLEDRGWIDIKKVTVFIGNQGSGKSTVAKLISTFTWIEKALVRGDVDIKWFSKIGKFRNPYLAYHRLDHYSVHDGALFDETEIEYKGDAYHIKYDRGALIINEINNGNYPLPQIMYVPAERNFVTNVKNPRLLNLTSGSMTEFVSEYGNALNKILEPIHLPINNVDIEYNRQRDIVYIKGQNYKLKLTDASSGFQSFVPLFLVSQYLSNSVKSQSANTTDNMSSDEIERFKKGVATIWADNSLTDEQRRAALSVLSSKFNKTAFINIVEEPEQNLFPTSQWEMVKSLLEFNNLNKGNKLIMTTHSPYIINFISIAIQGAYLKNEILNHNKPDMLEKLEHVIPKNSIVDSSDVVVYQLDEKNGVVTKLPSPEGIPSDKNYLNQSIRKGNELFDSLLEIEEEL